MMASNEHRFPPPRNHLTLSIIASATANLSARSSWVTYYPLKANEIRLLTLQPGSKRDIIQCTICHGNLRESPKYEAVSYMWGSEHFLKQMEIDGRICSVRNNLWTALWHLRLRHKQRILWVDALCINQSDDVERGVQVAQMGLIYRQASAVCVWLGPASSVARETIEFLEDELTIKEVESGSIYYSRDWDRVRRLCTLDYWGRLWIIQEVVLARKLKLYWGTFELSWDCLDAVLYLFESRRLFVVDKFTRQSKFASQYPFSREITESTTLKICQQRRRRTELSSSDEPSLYSLLRVYDGSKCVDFRDKIFGLRSLVRPCCRSATPVDYTCSAYKLCNRVLKHHLCFHWHPSFLDSAISMSQDLHRLLVGWATKHGEAYYGYSGSRSESDGLTDDKVTNDMKRTPIEVQGYLGGCVSHVTPALKDISLGEYLAALPVDLLKTLSQISSHKKNFYKYFARGMNLVENIIGQDTPYSEKRDSKSMDDGSLSLAELRKLQLDAVLYTTQQTTEETTVMIYRHEQAEEILSSIWDYNQPAQKDSVFFFEENGMVGVAPVAAEVGDFVCRFSQSDVIAIMRKVEEKYLVVGRAVQLEPLAATVASGQKITFQLDIQGLQLLTRTWEH